MAAVPISGRSGFARIVVLGGLAFLIAAFAALGLWQIQRRAWKLELIAHTEQRVHAAPVAAPAPADWPSLSREGDEYRVVRLSGNFLAGHDTLVKAVTELGGGYWVMTPLRTDAGFTVLVNRGFVPGDGPTVMPAGAGGRSVVMGPLRLTEPGGAFLHRNLPGQNRWYSRDVAAIAQARGVADVAPYFVDAEGSGAGGWPRGGLTVLNFPNNHLVYAITWFSLAFLVAGLGLRAWRTEEWT